ncbi:MAG: hypothetical protein ACRCV6_08475 [Formosimonas sp.]
MQIDAVFQDKSLKAKAKVAQLGDALLSQELSLSELLAFAQRQKASDKATCIEAVEYATKKSSHVATEDLLHYVVDAAQEPEPRVKWESAKVIGNIAKLFPEHLSAAVAVLLANARHEGTVVRWAAAYALAEIVKLKTAHNAQLVPELAALCAAETDNAIQKKYSDALKKVSK